MSSVVHLHLQAANGFEDHIVGFQHLIILSHSPFPCFILETTMDLMEQFL